MLFQLTTDNHIAGREELARRVEDQVRSALERFTAQITRVEVHLADENSHKKGDGDKRCTLEARLAGRQPVSVHHDSGTLDAAVEGAVEKMVKVLEKTIEKLGERKGRTSFGGEQTI